jgi:hypothetical protein
MSVPQFGHKHANTANSAFDSKVKRTLFDGTNSPPVGNYDPKQDLLPVPRGRKPSNNNFGSDVPRSDLLNRKDHNPHYSGKSTTSPEPGRYKTLNGFVKLDEFDNEAGKGDKYLSAY